MNLDPEEYRKTLAGFGLPDFLSAGLAHADSKIAEGALADVTSDLSTLIGRPTTTVAEAITDALKA